MGLLGVLKSFKNAQGTYSRAPASSYDAGGHRVSGGAAVVLPVSVVIEPAIGVARVVGGRDQVENEQGQQVVDVRVVYTKTELRVRTPTNEPDYVTFADSELVGTWEVFRVEHWNLKGQVHYRVDLTRATGGAS